MTGATARFQGAATTTRRTRRRRSFSVRLAARLGLLDLAALAAGWALGWVVAGNATSAPVPAPALQLDDIAVGVAASLACFALLGLYRVPSHGTRSTSVGTAAQAVAVAAVVVTGWQAVIGNAAPGLSVGAAGGGFAAAILARYCFDVWLIGCRRQGRYLVPVVVAGTGRDAAALVEFLDLNPEAGFRAAGVVGGRRNERHPTEFAEPAGTHVPAPARVDDEGASVTPLVPWLGGYDEAVAAVRHTGAAGVLVAVNHIPTGALHTLLHDVSAIGLPVHLSSGITGVAHSRLRTMPLAHEPFLVLEPLHHSVPQRAVKRALDLVLAVAALMLTAPVLGLCALGIKLGDGGPVLFRQVRVGRDGTTFRCLKLRTMAVDAEDRLAELRERNERHGPLFKIDDDPRVTRIGHFLRSTGLDELPQFVNVLRGDMSVVGPRPALPSEAATFDPELQTRHVVRPGLTGLWQTEANHKASFEEYRRLDLFYVKNWSVALDLSILINTIPTLSRRAFAALRRSAPTAPAPISSPPPASDPDVGRLATGPVPSARERRRSAVRRASADASGRTRRGRNPHVLVIVQNLPVPLDRRVWMESKALVAAGFDVSVICPRGDKDGVRDSRFEELEGVRIHRYAPPRPATGTLSYVWEFAYCWLRTAGLSLRIFARRRFDVIQACNPPDTYFALARLYRVLGVRFVFDHHDLCPELFASRDLSKPPSKHLMRALRLLERGTYATADHVITTNESYRDTARARTGKSLSDITIVRSSPDPATMTRQEPVPELRNGRRHLAVYLGIMGRQDGVDMVLRAARVLVHDLGRDDIQFALLGFGDTLEGLKRLATELDLDDHVTFTGRVGPADIGRYLSTAGVGLCPDPKTPFNDRSTMNKVLEYMAHELPVVSFDLSETLRAAGPATSQVTWLGNPEADAKAFGLAVVDLLDDPDRSTAMGRLGRARIENGMGWPTQAANYVAAYDRLVGRTPAVDAGAGVPVQTRPSTRSRDLQGV
ncbi:MAG TPA: exopolysaccharide biosynthesis polyprenyl glycosylphosphotransferase [Acidimicrobiales bacterium]|nr:exopolysaccharide biosynthesis polyprenyl glycosylphosphotransferase [Acidimicrobiales bacterium]